MCGILGFVDTPWQEHAPAALDALASRGPDSHGLWRRPPALLAHRRLAVIDPAGGNQPMSTADGRYTIVFNGEIYNFEDLRQALLAEGRVFHTRSDTEVILQGYAQWGKELAPRLDGMFAFAIWDDQEQTLFAARDRIGIKPFFYSNHKGFSFSSTLESYFRLDGFPRRIDWEALRDYLAFHTVLAPRAMLRDVRQLPPAHQLTYDRREGEARLEQYWMIPGPQDGAPPREEILDRVDQALADAVRRQLTADAPLGAFLSGGIDSSLMVHYMARAQARPLQTFSVGFADGKFDERQHARAVAERFDADHHVFEAPAIGQTQLLEAVRALDQPLADPAYVATYELSRLTRRHVTVAISGDGGDELFGGYGRFRQQAADYPASTWKTWLRRGVEARLLPGALLRRSLTGRDLIFYRHVELGPYAVSRKSLKHYLSEDVWRRCHPAGTLERWTTLLDAFGGRYDTDGLMRADLWTYLSENCLMKTDRASMAHGLEARVPMLGNGVLDAVLPLPATAHFHQGDKAILRELARRHLPECVWNRPKHGFSVPLIDFLSGPWRDLGDETFAKAERLAPFLRSDALGNLWRRVKRRKASARLGYTFIVLLLWLETHHISE